MVVASAAREQPLGQEKFQGLTADAPVAFRLIDLILLPSICSAGTPGNQFRQNRIKTRRRALLARRWRYVEYDGAYFRGPADVISIEQVWSPTDQKWLPYRGENAFKRGWFGARATKEEAESQHWENGRLVTNR